jgi:uncharacterized damage-inducible protein DinB
VEDLVDAVVSSFASLIALNDRLLNTALEGLTDEEGWRHPGDANPIHWIAGHVARYRNGLAGVLGVGLDLPWASAFEMKTQPDPAECPATLAQIREAIVSLSERLSRRLAEMTDEELAAPAPFKVRVPDQTIRGLITFMTFHEIYHVGQITYVKKWLGYPGVVDGQ